MHFERISSAPWIDAAEERLGFPLPSCLTQILRKYVFSDFIIKGLHHYDNNEENTRWSWHVALFRDQPIFEITKARLFLPIGQPDEYNYDRICLDLNRLRSGDCPVVVLDHEEILLKDKIKIVKELAPSYRKLTAKVIDDYFKSS